MLYRLETSSPDLARVILLELCESPLYHSVFEIASPQGSVLQVRFVPCDCVRCVDVCKIAFVAAVTQARPLPISSEFTWLYMAGSSLHWSRKS